MPKQTKSVTSISPSELSLTDMLVAANSGDTVSYAAVYDRSYAELRSIARAYMKNVPLSDTLQPTALVNEAFTRIVGRDDLNTTNSREFYGVLSRAMRDILVDQARRHGAKKRGGDWSRVSIPIDDVPCSLESNVDVVLLDRALSLLHEVDPDSEEIVRLRFYCGLSLRDIAKLQEISLAAVRQNWDFTKTWLFNKLS